MDIVGAHDAYEEALKLEPTNEQAKNGLNAVKRAMEAEAREDGATGDPLGGGLGGIFNDPQVFQKLAQNPKTSGLLADSDFMSKLQRVRQNPNTIGEELKDPRFLQVMGVLMGFDLHYGGAPETGQPRSPVPEFTAQEKKKEPEDEPMPDQKEEEEQPEEDEEAAAKKKAVEAGDAEKKTGNEFYKKKQFDQAIEHYTKAWELNKDITYLNNIGAAKFENGDLHGAIEVCAKAAEEGHELHADFKTIAK